MTCLFVMSQGGAYITTGITFSSTRGAWRVLLMKGLVPLIVARGEADWSIPEFCY